jgi:hypothetical protein
VKYLEPPIEPIGKITNEASLIEDQISEKWLRRNVFKENTYGILEGVLVSKVLALRKILHKR